MNNAELKIAKEMIKLGKLSSNSNYINTAKASAKVYGVKKPIFPGEKKITTSDGFEAYINPNQYQLIHEIKSNLALKGISSKKSKNPYLKGSQQLILKMPLDANEEKKREFLTRASKYFKNLVKIIEFKDGKIKEITHRPKMGKKLNLLKDLQRRNRWIIKRVKELSKESNAPKQSIIFKQIGQEIVSHRFGNLSIDKPLSSARVKNIYFHK